MEVGSRLGVIYSRLQRWRSCERRDSVLSLPRGDGMDPGCYRWHSSGRCMELRGDYGLHVEQAAEIAFAG